MSDSEVLKIEVVPLSELAQHSLARSGENVVGEFLVVVSGAPRNPGDDEKVRNLLREHVFNFGREVGSLLNSAHTKVSDFIPTEYFK